MQSVFSTYFTRFDAFEKRLTAPISDQLGIIIIIPCYNEPNIIQTIHSFSVCTQPHCDVEIIVVVNHGENAPQEVCEQNEKTIKELVQAQLPTWLHLHTIYAPNLPQKHAGVGLARKIAMDEATHRFAAIDNSEGVIISCDADTLVDINYLTEIEKFYIEHPECGAANIYFEHPLNGNLPENQYISIAQYELYLRYYVEQLRTIKFPFAYHTIGSCFSLRVKTYCRQGGMNKRQAGEDFYFLQKLFQSEIFGEITSTKALPSSRISYRVPFGTGTAISKLSNCSQEFPSFNNESFLILHDFFSKINEMYSSDLPLIYRDLHKYIQAFLPEKTFIQKVEEIRSNAASLEQFRKRFFVWFNGFMVFKFLNFVHQNYLPKIPICTASAQFLNTNETDVFTLLKQFRERQSHAWKQ